MIIEGLQLILGHSITPLCCYPCWPMFDVINIQLSGVASAFLG